MATLNNIIKLDEMSLNTQIASASDISTFVNTTASDTLGGAKTYTDAEISALSADFNARIAALEGFTSFIGVKDSLPETAEDGQICIVGNKEYIYGSKADGSVGWTELGDTTAETAAIDELSNAVADLETTKANASDVNASVEALTSAINDVEASLSGYDTVGSAAAAQEAAVAAAKAYTDEQIAAIEGEISSLTDVVETKADKATVDAAISAIEDDISALTAKEETDPVFTAWKDGTTVAIGDSAAASAYSNAMGPSANASGEFSNAIGNGALAIGNASNAIGSGVEAKGESSNAIGYDAKAEGESSNAIGNNASASGTYSNAIGYNASASGDSNALGNAANARGDASNAIGNNAFAEGESSNAIGYNANTEANGATQIGEGINSEENSFQFRNTQIVNGNGKITTANLAGIDTLKTALNNVAEVTASDDVATLRATVNALAAAIKAFAGL